MKMYIHLEKIGGWLFTSSSLAFSSSILSLSLYTHILYTLIPNGMSAPAATLLFESNNDQNLCASYVL